MDADKKKFNFGGGMDEAVLIKQGFERVDFEVPVCDRNVRATIISPPKQLLNPNPMLLYSIGGTTFLYSPPNGNLTAQYFWERGHRVLTFDAPGGSSLETLRDQVLKGPDPFAGFIEDSQAVLKACVDRKWATSNRVVVTGVSRFGYLAFRLLAADDQLKIGAGFSPVTDWRDLNEFNEQRGVKLIADLRISRFAEQLAGKKIYMTIGRQDQRVNTLSACQFFLDLNAANEKRGVGKDIVEFFVTPSEGHTCDPEWYYRGCEIIYNWMLSEQ